MERNSRRLRSLGARIALASALALCALPAWAATRSVEVVWTYPAGGAPYAGVALYYAASQSEISARRNLTRIDLGLPSEDPQTGEVHVLVPGFDDQRDYYLVLRGYDDSGRESPDSGVGVVLATAATPSSPPPTSTPPPTSPLGGNFESYRAGQDPDNWEDTASGSTALGDAALFETVALSDGTIAFGTNSSASDIHSHYSASSGRSSYEFTGRIVSLTLSGEAGVTVLSQFPSSLAYYRLARVGGGPFGLSVRGSGSTLACTGTASTGVSAQPGAWLRFRVRATRFDGRNRIRASVYPDGSSAPSAWQIDCWDLKANGVGSGSVGLYASQAPGTYWDDLDLANVSSDGAPPGYQPSTPTTTPPASGGYASQASLLHWWEPGVDTSSLGRDFAWRGVPVDAATLKKGVNQKDVVDGGTPVAFVRLNGKSGSFGNKKRLRFGIGDTWSVSAWVRPDALGKKKKPRYVLDLNGKNGKRAQDRISLMLDSRSRFTVEVSDAAGRVRSIFAPIPISSDTLGSRWYQVVAVKSGGTLVLYVDDRRVGTADVGVPQQTDSERMLRIGTRVKGGKAYAFAGGVHSIGVWSTALTDAEVRALFANGNRAFDPR